MKMTVVGDRVFIRPDPIQQFTDSGLEIVNYHDTSKTGTVVAVGDGPVSKKGVRMPHIVAVGERVVFPPDAGEDLYFEQEQLVAMREDDILAVID